MPKPVVLIVEDEPLLRMDAIDIIEEAGFYVLEADHAVEAVAILASRHDIVAIFTDVEMPGTMDGIALAHAVRDNWPTVGIMVASGRVFSCEDQLPPAVPYLRKPYRPAELIRALKKVA